jgi:deoxycytidine triphosphate deaminase
MVEKVWGSVCEAKKLKDHDGLELENASPEDEIIFVRPGETILAHTQEFIGGRVDITTMMKARSSLGRCACDCC